MALLLSGRQAWPASSSLSMPWNSLTSPGTHREAAQQGSTSLSISSFTWPMIRGSQELEVSSGPFGNPSVTPARLKAAAPSSMASAGLSSSGPRRSVNTSLSLPSSPVSASCLQYIRSALLYPAPSPSAFAAATLASWWHRSSSQACPADRLSIAEARWALEAAPWASRLDRVAKAPLQREEASVEWKGVDGNLSSATCIQALIPECSKYALRFDRMTTGSPLEDRSMSTTLCFPPAIANTGPSSASHINACCPTSHRCTVLPAATNSFRSNTFR
mmetsp:Transcript_3647/g.10486  ORF Transcript_3647/g.10486 Transcript_3647/m.10486 type:complete len:275 (+) Transcript_3647:174-998(+)